ncbi:MAG: molybdenum cofactor biosynthesis protein MoaE [Polyangiales bacterium]
MFEVRAEPLSVESVVAAVSHPGAGGIDVFLGAVRDSNEGRAVAKLEYEAYATMAVREMERIGEELSAAFPGVRLAAVHRVGSLSVGDLAVVCAASAPHRGEAFEACRRLIDEIKARVPVWKREWGPDGPYWINWVDARCSPDGHDHAHEHHEHDAHDASEPHEHHAHEHHRR